MTRNNKSSNNILKDDDQINLGNPKKSLDV